MKFTAAEVAAQIGGVLVGDGNVELSGFAPAGSAKAGDLTFAENETFYNLAEQSLASAILVDKEFAAGKKSLIRVVNARIAFAKVLALFFPESRPAPGIHPTAVVAPTAAIDPTAHIGPHCTIGDRVHIGARCSLLGLNAVGADSQLGEDSLLFPNTTLYPRTQVGKRVRIHSGSVIGADGFGYVIDAGVHRKIPQIGWVSLADDVEIGANVTIDRGALGPTSIGRGTKIDNLVQVAHNVSVGDHCLIVAQVGVAGSTKLGNYVTLAGQVGVAGHLKIGNGVTVTAQSGVMHDIPDGQKWLGSPAQPDRVAKRQLLALHHMPEKMKRLADLERQLHELRAEMEAALGKAPV